MPAVLAPSPVGRHHGAGLAGGVVVVANAEVLAGLVVHQLARAGAPFLYGAGVGVLNMRTMVEAYRAPGVALGNQACVDLSRWYGLPSWAYAGDSDSKLCDEQAAAEAAMGALLGELCRATLLHDVGYLESGLQSSYEHLVLGDELVGYARAFGERLPFDDEALALDEIMLAGPGGNHLARPMTRRRYRDFPPVQLARPVGLRALAGRGRDHAQAARGATNTGVARRAPPTFKLDRPLRRRLDQIVEQAAPRPLKSRQGGLDRVVYRWPHALFDAECVLSADQRSDSCSQQVTLDWHRPTGRGGRCDRCGRRGTALAVTSSAPCPGASASPGSLVVRIGQLQTPDSLNPFIGIQGLDYQIWHLNYDFLVGFDAKTLAPRPELATSWSVSPNGKTWTFRPARA